MQVDEDEDMPINGSGNVKEMHTNRSEEQGIGSE